MDISLVIIFNEVFIKTSSTKTNIQKNTVVIGKTFFFMIGLFLAPFFIYLKKRYSSFWKFSFFR